MMNIADYMIYLRMKRSRILATRKSKLFIYYPLYLFHTTVEIKHYRHNPASSIHDLRQTNQNQIQCQERINAIK